MCCPWLLWSHQHFHILRIQQMRHCIRGGLQVGQASDLGRFLYPFLAVAVAVKEDTLMFFDHFLDQVMQVCLKVLCSLQSVCILLQALRDRGVQHYVTAGNAV